MPLNSKEFENSLADLPEEDKFGTVLEDSGISGTITDFDNVDHAKLSDMDFFDGYETHRRAFADYVESALKITTTDGEFYLIGHRGDHDISIYKVKE